MESEETNSRVKSLLRLFKCYDKDRDTLSDFIDDNDLEFVRIESLSQGILYEDYYNDIRPVISDEVMITAKQLYGIDVEALNQTFHKSFKTVKDTSIKTLIAQQILHYFSTYGIKTLLGEVKDDMVYIPKEQLDIPEFEGKIILTRIKGLYKEEIHEKLMVLLKSGIALSAQTVSDILTLTDYLNIKEDILEIKNREVKIALYDKENIVPEDPTEFLRFLIYKITGNYMLIQDKGTIETIKYEATCDIIYEYLSKYICLDDKVDPTHEFKFKQLAEIFLRYKKLFIAMKMSQNIGEHYKDLRNLINRLSREARKNHPAIYKNVLDNLTNIKNIDYYNANRSYIFENLDKVNLFRIIRILNILKYSCFNDNKERIYKIRNGKVWISPEDRIYSKNSQYECNNYIFNDIYKEYFIPRLSKIVKDKIIFIPKNIRYTAPQSEKQFIGNLPFGSSITIDKNDNMIFGIHWENLEDIKESISSRQVDLDLKLINKEETYGWNNNYKSIDNEILFSGDVTNAPKPDGATEVFYIGKNQKDKDFIIDINKFTGNNNEVPFELIIAKAQDEQIYKNYMINPNNIIIKLNCSFPNNTNMITLGNLSVKSDYLQIFFTTADKGKDRVSDFNNLVDIQNNYYAKYNKYQLNLQDILYDAGAKIINEDIEKILKSVTSSDLENKEAEIRKDIDLSLETLTKESIINLFIESN